MNKKLKWLAVLFVLLAVVCNAADCASRIGLDGLLFPGVRAPHEPTKPAPLIPYSKVTKICFTERFGEYSSGRYVVEVTATRDLIEFRCIKGDALREHEEEITEKNFECGQGDWDDLIAVFDGNHVNTWKRQGNYLNQSYGEPGIFEEWPEVDFVSEGDFFNITDGNLVWPEAKPPYFYGIDQNEKIFRSDYHGYLDLYTNNDEESSFGRAYESYGLPKEYNQFRKEFWDLIVGHTGLPDWRLELGDWGRENLYKKYPYMLQESQEGQIRYFSLLENYGGKDSAMGIALVYDGGEGSLLYRCCSYEKIYSVGKSGLPTLYCDRASVPIWRLESEKEAPDVPEGLPEIIERYGVGNWETENSGAGYVRQGEFYNIENAKQAKDKNEQVLRSGYDALIHVVYTDGRHMEIQLENGQLPETYNDFRDELWDHMLLYINEGMAQEEQVADWRGLIDQWGEEYLREKYPYIR